MKKTFLAKITSALLFVTLSLYYTSCTKKEQNPIPELQQISSVQKSHKWFYFTNNGYEQIDLPQNAPMAIEKPWTEAIRISSAASIPNTSQIVDGIEAYAVVNHLGVLAFSETNIEMFNDASFFSSVTADSLVFSKGVPVFYLYKSSFFNESLDSNTPNNSTQKIRPFLVEFEPATKIFIPLVSYENLKLEKDFEINGYFWDGKTWTCSAKKAINSQVEFKYFLWQPLVELTELTPAISNELYIFKSATEDTFRQLNMPKTFNNAPQELKKLASSIPQEFSFYVSWRDTTGTSPVSYYQQGNGASSSSINAKGLCAPNAGYTVLVFADGTTYINKTAEDKIYAFRLPLLPAGYTYSEVALAGNSMYVSWEENNFYKTARSGFIQINLTEILSKIEAKTAK